MLRSLVETACKALKDEDDYLRTKNASNAVYSGQRAGILRPGYDAERYYQRLIARQLHTRPYQVLLEKNRYDLVLAQPGQTETNWFAVIEMKKLEDRAAKIISDIERLKAVSGLPQHRVMLIFNENPATFSHGRFDDLDSCFSDITIANIKWLCRELRPILGVPLTRGHNFEVASFPTYSDWPTVRHLDMEFWVGGIEVEVRPTS